MRLATLAIAATALVAQAGGARAAMPAAPLAAAYAAAVPAQLGAGTDTAVPVTVTNLGDETWHSTSAAPGAGQIGISYHWYDLAGTVVTWDGLRAGLGSDVAPQGSASTNAVVRAPATPGTYVLRLALIKEAVAWLAPSQPFTVRVIPAYSGSIGSPQVTSLITGQTYTIPVTVTNSGSATWNAAGPQPVTLSYHWHDAAGNTVVWDGMRTPLPSDVAPGASVTVQVRLAAPATSGTLRLTLDLVREGVAWFQTLGSTPTRVVVRVAPVTYSAQYGVGVTAASYIGETRTIPVTITNSGNVPWSSASPVNLAYHIVDAAGQVVTWDGSRALLGDVAIGASTTVQLTYTTPTRIGDYTLLIDAVREGVAWFSSIGTPAVRLPMHVDSGFGAGYGASTTPALATIGARLTLRVDVNNYGPRTLSAGGPNPVHLSYHLLGGGGVVVWDGLRGGLPADLGPSQSATVELDVQLPSAVGNYTIAWDLVQEGVGWMSQLGIPQKREQITVQPGVTFYGKGFGHGLGMSQWGAQGMATGAGGRPPMSGQQIATYYYPGTSIGAIPGGSPNPNIRVLLSQPSSQGRYTCGAAYYDGNLANLVSNGGFRVLNEGSGNAEIFKAGPGVAVQFYAVNGNVQVWDQATARPTKVYEGPGPVSTVPLDPAKATNWLEKGWYRGNFRFTYLGGTLRVVNVASYDDYVRGVVPLEMLSGWNIEAYKAQALAARSYAYASYQPSRDYDVFDDQSSQCYGGVQMTSGRKIETDITNAAVDGTLHQFITYNGTPIRAYFSSSDGGYTKAVGCWANNAQSTPSGVACAPSQPYLTPVADPWDTSVSVPTANKQAGWQVTFSSDTIRNAVLNMRGIDIGPLTSVDLSNRSPAVVGHVVSVKITGQWGSVDLPADNFLRSYLFLKSTMVRLAPW